MGRAKFPGEFPGEKGKKRESQLSNSVKRVVSTNDNITSSKQAAKRHEIHDDVNWTSSVIELISLAALGE